MQNPKTGRKPGILEIQKRSLKRIIKNNRRSSYAELSVLWTAATGKQMSRTTCHRTASKMGFKAYKVIV